MIEICCTVLDMANRLPRLRLVGVLTTKMGAMEQRWRVVDCGTFCCGCFVQLEAYRASPSI